MAIGGSEIAEVAFVGADGRLGSISGKQTSGFTPRSSLGELLEVTTNDISSVAPEIPTEVVCE